MRLKGKVAFVTGASRGIGEAIAERFATEGARVCLAARSEKACDDIAARINEQGHEALSLECDVTRPSSVAAAIASAISRWGRINILVNNAGTSGSTPVDSNGGTDEVWNTILETNLTAVFRVTREALGFMPEGGRIINQSSVLGRFGVPGYAAYVASKHGLIGLTRTMALELAPRKITVNAICPGWVETELARAGFARIAESRALSLEEARQLAAGMAPLGRVLDPSEVASLAVFIASDEASNLTGQAVVLDGGQVMP
jgi:NAD(P)-dependent dehydrogenase (short-subunit alcohol dehydrogenase family)